MPLTSYIVKGIRLSLFASLRHVRSLSQQHELQTSCWLTMFIRDMFTVLVIPSSQVMFARFISHIIDRHSQRFWQVLLQHLQQLAEAKSCWAPWWQGRDRNANSHPSKICYKISGSLRKKPWLPELVSRDNAPLETWNSCSMSVCIQLISVD